MSFNLDFLKLLGDEQWLFPRKLMTNTTNGQVVVYEEGDVLKLVRNADFLDCFIQTHTAEDREKGFLRVVFIDIDFKDDLNKARKITDRVLQHLSQEYEINPYCQFSGNKGYHILIPIKTIRVPDGLVQEFLTYLQTELSKGYCDSQILGDVVRLWRLPYTYNSKGILKGMNSLVKPYRKWGNCLFNVKELWGQFQLLKLKETIQSKNQKKANARSFHYDRCPRPEVVILIDRARQGINLTHSQRLAVLFEMIANGFTDEEIHEVFYHIPDYEDKITQYFIAYSRKRGYRPFKTQKLRKML